jgi:hypothetical protein
MRSSSTCCPLRCSRRGLLTVTGRWGLAGPLAAFTVMGMMRPPSAGAMRIARGLVCAVMCLLLGSLAHGLSAGRLPGPGAMVLAFGALATVGIAVADKKRGFVFITAVLGGAQLSLHVWFTVAAMFGPAGSSGVGHQHFLAEPSTGSAVAAGHPVAHVGLYAPTWPMVFAHVVATLGSAACMAYAERVVWLLARMVLPLLEFLLARPWPRPAAVLVGRCASSPMPLPARYGMLLARRRLRRGPPRPMPV